MDSSPFDEDPIMSAVAGAPAASLAPVSNQQGAAPAEAVGGTNKEKSAPVPAGDDLLGLGGATGADAKADLKDKAPEQPKGPTPYSIWEGKRAQVLAERQAKADEAKRQLAATAKDEIAKFYAQRTERIATNKTANRQDEKSTKAEIAALFQFGAQWEKVGKLMNIAPKANEKRNVDRMRRLMLSLKNDNAAAGSVGAGAGTGSDGAKKGTDSKAAK